MAWIYCHHCGAENDRPTIAEVIDGHYCWDCKKTLPYTVSLSEVIVQMAEQIDGLLKRVEEWEDKENKC